MKGLILNLLLAVALSFIFACGGAKKAVISQSEISQAESNGSLESLYRKINATIAESSGSSKEKALVIKSQIVERLVASSEKKVDQGLSNKTEFDLVSRENISEIMDSIEPVRDWDQVAYNRIKKKINFEQANTNTAIAKELKSASHNSGTLDIKLAHLKKAGILAGENSIENENYQKERKSGLVQLSKDGRDAFQKRMFNTAIKKANMGLLIDKGNIEFESLLAQADAALFKQKFNEALQKGKPEVAYSALLDIADKPIMLQIKKNMGRDILLLANYFANNAQVAYKKGNLYLAYTEFKRGRDIQEKLSSNNKGFIQEKAYLDLLKQKSVINKNNYGNNFALLQIIKEFDDSYPTLNESLSTQTEKIIARSMTKISLEPFMEVTSSNSVIATVGRRIASKLEKILFKNLADEILIVKDIANAKKLPFSGPHYQIEGEVLQSAIETNKNKARRSKNVQTGINKIETPEYIKWKKRSKGEAPVQYSETPIMEDIILSLEHVSKLAVVELDYKIVSPISQKVLKANNINKEENFKGTMIQEFEKGLFHQPFVPADLPRDIKIMDQLATSLSEDLGKELVKYLTGTEKSFYAASLNSKGKGDKLASIEMLANAVVVNTTKLEKVTVDENSKVADNNAKLIETQKKWIAELKSQALKNN